MSNIGAKLKTLDGMVGYLKRILPTCGESDKTVLQEILKLSPKQIPDAIRRRL